MGTGEITALLADLRAGRREATNRLFPLVYDELRLLARRQLRGWRPGSSLATTALVHEAYLKLVDHRSAEWADRRHFFAVAATAMRQILVDAARRRRAGKRGGRLLRAVVDADGLGFDERAEEILALDLALGRLQARSERLVRTVELRFFAGLSVEETAEVLGVSERTVKRDWRKARAFLHADLSGSGRGSAR